MAVRAQRGPAGRDGHRPGTVAADPRSPQYIVVLLFLSLVGTAAFLAWFREATCSHLDLLTTWTKPMPVIGIGVSLFLPGERPPQSAAAGTGLGLGLASTWLVLRRRSRRTGRGTGTKDSDAAGQTG